MAGVGTPLEFSLLQDPLEVQGVVVVEAMFMVTTVLPLSIKAVPLPRLMPLPELSPQALKVSGAELSIVKVFEPDVTRLVVLTVIADVALIVICPPLDWVMPSKVMVPPPGLMVSDPVLLTVRAGKLVTPDWLQLVPQDGAIPEPHELAQVIVNGGVKVRVPPDTVVQPEVMFRFAHVVLLPMVKPAALLKVGALPGIVGVV
jgi:hypothetical protein